MTSTDPFYLSPRWRRKRERILRRDGYVCQILKRYGRSVPANTVHHIFPRSAYPEWEWADWNLISVSDAGHKLLHTPNGDLSEEGRRLQERLAAKLEASPPGRRRQT